MAFLLSCENPRRSIGVQRIQTMSYVRERRSVSPSHSRSPHRVASPSRSRSCSPRRVASPSHSRLPRRVASPSHSCSPRRVRRSRSLSRSRGRSRSRSRDSGDAGNPGNNLYVTGLSARVTTGDLEKYFSSEGRVKECHLVTDPRSRESRGFGFVTMETVEDADRCVKYLNRSVLEGRLITVEKAKRRRGRTPTPGRYRGLKDRRGRDRRQSRSYSPHRQQERDHSSWRDRRKRSRSPYRRRVEEYSD